MTPIDLAVLIAYSVALGLLAIYGVHRLYLVKLLSDCGGRAAALGAKAAAWPPHSIAVQLPLYNEPNVAARLIDAVAQLDYDGALAIQVLDDSNDATTAIVAERVAMWSARGVDIAHIRRGSRDGFKAGALAHGMALSDAQLFAVFDADFVPPRTFLRDVVPHFADGVGMVQARWAHLNRDESMLTRVQAIYLDGHFAIESAARHLGGRFFNFNGTAGVWRREAIDDAGGWSASTLTEDLDLSYRAQLAGWKFVFLPSIEVPAELPGALSGFQEQQHRWAKGSIQTARKILPRIARSEVPLGVKTEAFFHLTNNAAYVLTVIVALLMVPAIVVRQRLGSTWTFAFDALVFILSTASVLRFYIEGQRLAGRGRMPLRELLAVMPIGVGISIRNAAAVLEGMFENGGTFRRTPKRGEASRVTRERAPRLPIGELVLALFFAVAFVSFAFARQWISLPFLLLFLSGYGWAAVAGFRERVAFALHF